MDPDGADGILGGNGPDGAAAATDDNFHLQSTVGSFRPLTGTFRPDAQLSPAIDRGQPGDAFDQEPAPNGGAVNLARTAIRPRLR